MLKITRRPEVKVDLIKIWLAGYERWGEAQADSYFEGLEQAIYLIAENPKIGVACDYIRKDYRQYHFNRHIIFYRLGKHEIEIVRVLRDNMDFQRHF